MTRILIVEGNTPELVERGRAAGRVAPAENFAAVLTRIAVAGGAAVETAAVRPYFPEFDIDALELEGIEGVVFTGSGVAWSTDAPEGAVQRAVMERVFSAGLPAFGACNGLQLGAVVLGGSVRWNPVGPEVPVAADMRVTQEGADHPIHAGRGAVFACPCIHRDEVDRVPDGAVVTASNAHTRVQGMVVETGGVRFWGVQYHPELPLSLVARIVQGSNRATPNVRDEHRADSARIAAMIALDEAGDPEAPGLAALGIPAEVVDFDRRTVELRNWLAHALAVPLAGGAAAAAE